MIRTIRLPHPVDIKLTLRPLQHGSSDPTIRTRRNEAWRATRTPLGPGAQHIRIAGHEARVEAWGPGADWLLEQAPDLLGLHDDPAAFVPRHAGLRDLHRRHPGLRIGRSRAVVEAIVPTILEQKVTGTAARRSFRAIVRAYGEPAPGPTRLWLQPQPKVLASLGYHELHPLGVERKRAATLKLACSYAKRLEETVEMEPAAAKRRLLALPGVGEWTAALVAGTAWGDRDAVEVGDFHVPNLVAWYLAREPRGTDARMLELLEPYAGNRARVIRLIEYSGARAPRYGPRVEITDHSRI